MNESPFARSLVLLIDGIGGKPWMDVLWTREWTFNARRDLRGTRLRDRGGYSNDGEQRFDWLVLEDMNINRCVNFGKERKGRNWLNIKI